jgi:hypothetical protein
MANFLRNLRFDLFSFVFGSVFGLLILIIIQKLRPIHKTFRRRYKEESQTSLTTTQKANEVIYLNDIIRQAQEWHIAYRLFALDEIIIEPRLLPPPIPPEAYEYPSSEDITDQVIPFMPELPELASFYHAPTLSLPEALINNTNLAITSQPGCGKTVALAYLATLVARHETGIDFLSNTMPVLVHIADLVLPARNPEDILATLVNAISEKHNHLTLPRLKKLVFSIFTQKRALLLLDGLDELSPPLMAFAISYLNALLNKFPSTRIVVAASPLHLDGLIALGFVPIPLASWNQDERNLFTQRWGDQWTHLISKPQQIEKFASNPLLLTGWLLYNSTILTPLELTLKVWAGYEGDSLGSNPRDSFEAFISRITKNSSPKVRPALEELAMQMLLSMEPITSKNHAEGWLAGSINRPKPMLDKDTIDKASYEGKQERIRVSGSLPSLIECGLVIKRSEDRITFIHIEIAGYLARLLLYQSNCGNQLVLQPDWTGRITSLKYLSLIDSQSLWMNDFIVGENIDPLLQGLLSAAKWLRFCPEKLAWVPDILRKLVGYLQNENIPYGLKSRIITVLITSSNQGIPILMRQLLSSLQLDLKQLACLGCGLLNDRKAVPQIIQLIQDSPLSLCRAALLSLAAIDDKTGLEAVAYTLLHGNDGQRRAAAEALSNHSEDGHPSLEEGISIEDPMVRRASIFGLARIKQPWTIKILEKLTAEDPQWMVQDIAEQVISSYKKPNPRIPVNLPELTKIPWLINFAAERGIGVAPGQAAYELLCLALKEGNESQRLAAIYYLGRQPEEKAVLPLYHLYYQIWGPMRETSLAALWSITSAGIKLPPPIQYDLH